MKPITIWGMAVVTGINQRTIRNNVEVLENIPAIKKWMKEKN